MANKIKISRKLRVALMLTSIACTSSYADESVTEHERVYEALSPEMREAIEKIKEDQRQSADTQNLNTAGEQADMDVLHIQDHPVAVGAIGKDGELMISEF